MPTYPEALEGEIIPPGAPDPAKPKEPIELRSALRRGPTHPVLAFVKAQLDDLNWPPPPPAAA